MPDGMSRIGDAPKRREDQRFLTGQGRYLDDLAFDRLAHAVVLRSPHAHALIAGIDPIGAGGAPGVLAVLTAADIAVDGLLPLQPAAAANTQTGEPFAFEPQPLLAADKARHVGEAVALVVAETREQAQDAAELVAVEYRPLPAVTTTAAARAPGAPLLTEKAPGNLCLDWRIGDPKRPIPGLPQRRMS
jgi:aerobic carbon-monoxide dehydrogenase large subunit